MSSQSSKQNPSGWKMRIWIALISLLACGVSSYLGSYQWKLIDSVWDPFFGMQTQWVLRSEVSESLTRWILIPDAILGAVSYLGDALLALGGSSRRWFERPWLVVLFGLYVIPVGAASAILLVLQGTVVGSWCFLCMALACCSFILACLAYSEVLYSLRYLRVIQKSYSPLVFWRVLFGKMPPEAEKIAQEVLGVQ